MCVYLDDHVDLSVVAWLQQQVFLSSYRQVKNVFYNGVLLKLRFTSVPQAKAVKPDTLRLVCKRCGYNKGEANHRADTI